jgi:AcrR family transcriptional regulator
MTPRAYEQTRRAESAAETRHRILDALYERLREAPAQAVSVERLARMAGVARSTVYLIFGSRAGLFDALATDLMERSGHARLAEAVHQPDARATLRDGFRRTYEMYTPERDVLRALHSMAQLDEEAVGGAVRRIEEQRAGGMEWLAGRLAEQGELRADVSVKEAAHALWVLSSFEAFDLLATGRGLTTDAAADILVATAERAVCR